MARENAGLKGRAAQRADRGSLPAPSAGIPGQAAHQRADRVDLACREEAGGVVGCGSALQQCGDDLVDLPGIERCAVLGEEQVVHGADE